jgi:hypothetical protein
MGKRVGAIFVVSAWCATMIALRASAGTQQCNTACQSKMTDCILACDGLLSCELGCKSQAVACVNACSSDAGASTRVDHEGDAGDAGARDAKADALLNATRDAAREAASRDR